MQCLFIDSEMLPMEEFNYAHCLLLGVTLGGVRNFSLSLFKRISEDDDGKFKKKQLLKAYNAWLSKQKEIVNAEYNEDQQYFGLSTFIVQ